MTDRFLVMGDNHGDTESLRRVHEDIRGESIDLAIHVGDFTSAWRRAKTGVDEETAKAHGMAQLREVAPILADIEAETEDGLLWVWGQDYFGDLDESLDVGTEIPSDGHLTVGEHRFTNNPAAVTPEDILVTHMEKWSLIDHFEGRAHFCGNTHRGRYKDRRLNAAFLQVTEPEMGRGRFGGYFLVEMGDEPGFDVEMRAIGDLERVECDRHAERGVQFQPASRGCMYCRDHRTLMRELCASAFYGLTNDSSDEGVEVKAESLVAYAACLWTDPPEGFRADFRAYLSKIDAERYAPLSKADDGRFVLAERSYSY
ncbi:MAG: metallophosphoesterase [Halodesulfurarchaeum sp.]